MQIRVLGPLSVVREATGPGVVREATGPGALGGPRQRRVLAVLVGAGRQPISTARLIDGVWNGDPPRTARKTLHGYVHHLRAELGDAIQTNSDGYCLDLSDDEVDAWRFDHLADTARTLHRSDPPASIDYCSQALELWTGLAYEGFEDSELLVPEIARLTERRLEIVELRLQARLATGQAEATIAELESLTRQHPFRERFRFLHMTALYRSGRQAEALRSFDQTRVVLAEELGLDPGPELSELHQQILEQDPQLSNEPARTHQLKPPGAPASNTASSNGASSNAPSSHAPSPNTLATALTTNVSTRSTQTTSSEPELVSLRGYELREALSHSSTHAVFRAFHPGMSQEVVIRAALGAAANETYLIEHFDEEIRRLAKITQPTGALILDAWREPDAMYRVEPWLGGPSLRSKLTAAPLLPSEVLDVLNQIAEPLTQAHKLGFCHGQLRPAAIQFNLLGRVHLTDFGIDGLHQSWSNNSETGSERDSACHRYLPPEFNNGVGPKAPESDIFSLALLTADMLGLSIANKPGSANETSVPANPELDAVLRTATSQDLASRHHSVREFVSDVANALGHATAVESASTEQTGNKPIGPGLEQSAPEQSGLEQSHIRNPYKGLRAFQQSDAKDFFGREQLVERLLATVRSHRFVTVVGPSGVGKSSLVKAGLLPALRQSGHFSNPAILMAEMFPGRYPFEELLAALTTVAVARPNNGLDQLMANSRGLHRVLQQILPDDGRELLLVIDQFEELFSLVSNNEERKLFIANLVSAVEDKHSRLRVVLTLRADYYDRPLEFGDLGRLLEAATFPIRVPDLDDLRKAIEMPAAAVGIRLSPGLLDEIARDVVEQPGGLPLMQYALTELVDGRSSDLLTVEAYHEMGGLLGAVAARAEEIWQGLAPPAQRAIRQVFLRLVTIDEAATGMRRRALRRELNGLSVSQNEVTRTLQTYGDHRLLSFDRDPITRGPTIEVAHEALLRQWPRLGQWIDEQREQLILRRRLVGAMTEWNNSGHDSSFVLRGSRLAQYEGWGGEHGLMLTDPERRFLKIGEELRIEEEDAERQTNRRLRAMLVGAVIFAAIALIAGTVAVIQARRAGNQADVAEANRLDAEAGRLALRAPQLLESDRQVALLLAVEATQRAPDPVSLGALQEVLANTGGFLGVLAAGQHFDDVSFTYKGNMVGLSPDLLTFFLQERAWSSDTWPLTGATAMAVDPSPTRERVVVADALGVRLLTISDSEVSNSEASNSQVSNSDVSASLDSPILAGTADPVTVLTFNSTGTALAVGTASGDLTVIDLKSGRHQTWSPHPETEASDFEVPAHQPDQARTGVRALAFSPDGKQLATGGLVFARVWDLDSLALVQEFHLTRPAQDGQTNAAVRSLRFGPDNSQLSVASSFGVRLYDIESGQILSETLIEGRADAVGAPGTDSTVTLDEEALTIGLRGGEVVITDLTGGPTVRFEAQVSGEPTTATNRSGDLIAIGSQDGVVLWATTGQGLISRVIPRLVGSDTSFDVSGERIMVAAPQSGALRYFDLSGEEPRPLEVPGNPEAQFGWAGDEPGLMAWNFDRHELFLYTGEDLSKVQLISPFVPLALARHENLVAVGLGAPRNEALVQIVTDEGQLIAELDELVDPETGANVATLSFSPNGERLVGNTDTGAAAVWDTKDWQLHTLLSQGGGQIVVATYSPDGKYLVTMSSDGSILLRDPQSFQQLGPPLLGQVDGVSGFSYGPQFTGDGQYMFTAADGRLRIWDLDTRLQIGSGFPTDAGTTSSSNGLALKGATLVGDQIQLWNLDVDSWVDIACDAAGRNLTVAEWQQFGAKEEPYPTTCQQWPPDPRATRGS